MLGRFLLDTGAWESSVVLAQHDHAALTRNVTFHEALQGVPLVNDSCRKGLSWLTL